MEQAVENSTEEFIPEPEARPNRLRLNVGAAQRFIFAGLVNDYLVGDTIKAHVRQQREQRRQAQSSQALRKKLKKAMLTVRATVSFKAALKGRTRCVAEAITFLKQSRFSLVTQAPALESYRNQRMSVDQARQRARRQEKLQQARSRSDIGQPRTEVHPLITSMILVATQETKGDARLRCMHASVALQQGLLLLGGKRPFESGLGSELATVIQGMPVSLLDPKSNMLVNFEPGGKIAQPRFRHTASYLRQDATTELVVVIGGKSGDEQVLEDVDVLQIDQLAVDWLNCVQQPSGSAAGDFAEMSGPGARYGHCAVSWEDGILVFGGCDGREVLNDLWTMAWELQPDRTFQFSWRALPVANGQERPLPRQSSAMVKAGNSVYVFGGATSFDADPQAMVLGDLWSYDLVTQRWQEHFPEGPRPTPRCGHTCFVTGDILVMYGGQHAEMVADEDEGKLAFTKATRVLSDVWMLDLRTMVWTQVEPAVGYLPCRSFHTCSPMFYNGIFMAVIMFGLDPADQPQQQLQGRAQASATSVFCLCFTQPTAPTDSSPSTSSCSLQGDSDETDENEEKDVEEPVDEEYADTDGEAALELQDLFYLARL